MWGKEASERIHVPFYYQQDANDQRLLLLERRFIHAETNQYKTSRAIQPPSSSSSSPRQEGPGTNGGNRAAAAAVVQHGAPTAARWA
uniref:Uncharacterized protein n=1 Tax=Oryza nivara TaxID=4536 RepID=A0A0E0HIZ4_ORYNI